MSGKIDDKSPKGRVALVTGGTDGIGKEVARGLAREGIRVLIAGRDAAKGIRAAGELAGDTGGRVEFLPADLATAGGARHLADAVLAATHRLHYLSHGASIIHGRRVVTADGVEEGFAVNYLARFVLTTRLLPALEAVGTPSDPARVILVAGAGQDGEIFHDDPSLARNFSFLRALKQFQQANDVFAVELARRLAAGGPSRVTINCLTPGLVRTNIHREFPWWMRLLIRGPLRPLMKSPRRAAEAPLRLLLDPSFAGTSGRLFHGSRPIPIPARAADPEAGRRLWELSEGLAATRPVADGTTLISS